MLFKVASKNVKKNYKSYLTYFASVTFSVMMVYLFLAIFYNPVVNASFGSDKKFMLVFKIASVITVFFSAFFIWYSNSFFIKSRKKELATYMLLGMSKFDVFLLMLFENIIITIISFFFGIFIGVLFSKFFIMILIALMKVTINIEFRFEFKAFITSAEAFVVIFAVIAVHSAAIVYRYRLIDLFNAAKKREKAPKVSALTAFLGSISIIAIGYGYYLALTKAKNTSNIMLYVEFMLLIVAGTFMLFYSSVIFFIHLKRGNKERYYKGTNLISTTQLLYRYRGNAGSLAIISILSAVALTAMCFCYSFYSNINQSTKENRPFSLQYNSSNELNKKAENILKRHAEVSVKSKDNIKLLTGTINYSGQEFPCYMISETQYNKIAENEKYGEKVNLKGDNEAFSIDIEYAQTQAKFLRNSVADIKLENYYQKLNVKGYTTKRFIAVETSAQTFVVKDAVFRQCEKNVSKDKVLNITGYELNNDMKAGKLAGELNKIIPKENQFSAYYTLFEESFRGSAVMLFIGVFMGMLFLLATGSIIYFKQVVEASEDKYRYAILSKIGLDNKEIKQAVMKQLLLIFGLPLIVSIAHSYAASQLFGQMFHADLNIQYFVVLAAYAVLYLVYYFITVRSYTRIVTGD